MSACISSRMAPHAGHVDVARSVALQSKDKKHKKSKSKQKHRRGEQGKDKDDLVAQAKRFLKQQLSGGEQSWMHA